MTIEYLRTLKKKHLLLDVSLWSGDLLNMDASIDKTEQISDCYHLDVADAHFVHGLLFFPDLIQAINNKTHILLHSHLMMDNPMDHLDDFIEAGSDIITTHVELGTEKVKSILNYLNQKKIGAGLAICVNSDVNILKPYLEQIDLILVMGTQIGIKGVEMDPATPKRIEAIKTMLDENGLGNRIIVSVDGGIRTHTVPLIRAAGADMITPGSLIFKSEDIAKTVSWLYSL